MAIAIVNGQEVTSAPVPVRLENPDRCAAGPPQPPAPPLNHASASASPVADQVADFGGRPGLGDRRCPAAAQPVGSERATARSSSATSSQAKAGFKSVLGSGSKSQKSTAPATAKSTSLPAGTIVTIGLGPCTGPDPYAKHPTLKGECVSGTWFPRVRKAEPKRQE